MSGKPCPYAPFGIACKHNRGHGSPHLIEIEATMVEKILAKERNKGIYEYVKGIQAIDPELYEKIAAMENAHQDPDDDD